MHGPKFCSGARVSFLLAQVGAYAASRFAERLAPLGLTPSEAGILRRLGDAGGQSQQDLAGQLRVHPSRLVGLVDELETHGLVERKDDPQDRRSYALHLTNRGRAALAGLRDVSRDHNEAMCEGLSRDERDTLAGLLQRIVDRQGLTSGVHPGYQRLPARSKPCQTDSPTRGPRRS